MNETEKQTNAEKNENQQKPVIQAMPIGFNSTRGFHEWFSDFVTFKIMITPIIITLLYLMATILAIVGSFAINIFLGILMIFLAPFLVHIFFEFAMLLFSILDILREIRNKLQ